MASRATRYLTPVFRSGFRSSQTTFRASGRRGMATTTSPSTQSSDMPWIIGSGLVFIPTIAWILSSGKGEKHAHPAPKNASKEHVKVAEAVKEVPDEPAPEPVAAEPVPEPAPEEKSAEATPEPSASDSVVSDDEGVVVSKEEVEESINKAVDADVPKEAKAAEATPGSSPTPTESEPVKDGEAAAPTKEETKESTPSPVSEDVSTEKETKGH